MKKLLILPLILLISLVILNIAVNKGYILWIQGNINTTILRIIWLLLLVTIIIELLYLILIKKKQNLLFYVFLLLIIASGSLWLESKSVTTRYYYEEDGSEIIVVDNNKILFGSIKFFYKDSSIFSKEFASCAQSLGVTCEYHIEGNSLIIEMFGSGDLEERVVIIPSE